MRKRDREGQSGQAERGRETEREGDRERLIITLAGWEQGSGALMDHSVIVREQADAGLGHSG